ncbi:MAG TPA: hypothetical protein VH374_15200 [Polyangia bacterium]|jgi:hypothetical protein|nr:hypothetical protein [Polyangia bacterium]
MKALTREHLTWMSLLTALGCAGVKSGATGSGGAAGTTASGSGGSGGSTASGSGGNITPPPVTACPNNRCSDFPSSPIVDTGTPPDAPTMFGGAPSGAGPCVFEPEDGALFPRGWLRPRFKWSGTTGVHRITIHADQQDKDLVAYTSQTSWTMPKDIWTALGQHTVEQDITVTVRAASGGESAIHFQISSAAAGGSVVFWAAKPEGILDDGANTNDLSELRGFSVGDESTVSVLQIAQVKQPSMGEDGEARPVACIGCHAATPDHGYVGFIDDFPWNLAIAGVNTGIQGDPLPGLTDGGKLSLNMPYGGMMAFSPAQWATGHRLVLVASSLHDYVNWRDRDDSGEAGRLIWYNLDGPPPVTTMDTDGNPIPTLTMGTNYGEVARTGDTRGAANPTWSHDGNDIVYCSTTGTKDGEVFQGTTDLYKVSFAGGSGGPAAPLMGAADPGYEEYYPAYSPDDKLIVFNRVPAGERAYANPDSELFVVPAAGGTAVSLKANTPPACTGKKTPGVNNHWGRWSPRITAANGKNVYWMLFSSYRSDIPPSTIVDDETNAAVQITQLYITAVVQDSAGQIQTYPAIYLWNQPITTINATPIWEDIQIPLVQ